MSYVSGGEIYTRQCYRTGLAISDVTVPQPRPIVRRIHAD